MSSSALVTLLVDVFLPHRASWNFASLYLDLRMSTLFILVEHATCFCSELICSVYHSVKALL